MKKVSKLIALLLCAVMTAGCFASCGEKSEEGEDDVDEML